MKQIKPNCFDRPAFKDFLTVQDGWKDGRRNMVTIPFVMSRECHQNTPPFGEAVKAAERGEKWECDGCRHFKGAR